MPSSRLAPPPAPRRIKRRILPLTFAALLLAGIPILCNSLRAHRDSALHAQWMEYEPSPGTIAYEEEPIQAAQLLATGNGYFVIPDSEDNPPLTSETPVAHFPPQAKGLQSLIPGGCAFLHWLRRQEEESLVFVSLQLGPGDPAKRSTRTLTFTPYKISSASTRTAPRPAGPPYIMHLTRADLVRVLAGQRDLGDTAHFTIDLFKNGRPGTLHGILQPDGNVLISPTRAAPVLTK
jgi:hypothetical protein